MLFWAKLEIPEAKNANNKQITKPNPEAPNHAHWNFEIGTYPCLDAGTSLGFGALSFALSGLRFLKMKVIFLGTGAGLPTLRRNTSAIAAIREGEWMLFDCGEGTQIQMQKAGLKPGKLSRIFITHLHGDHFYGLIGLLTSLQLSGRDKPLDLYGPYGLNNYLAFMQDLSLFRFSFTIAVHEAEPETEASWELPDFTIEALPLEHRIHTLGFRLQFNALAGKFDAAKAEMLGIPAGPERNRLLHGESITLSNGDIIHPEVVVGPARPGQVVTICGDSRPCENAVRLARDADLLVHEATFDDPRRDLAEVSRHSTASEAAEIARQAHASKLVLIHISSRIGEDEEKQMLATAQSRFPNTIIARDLLTCEL